jgi:hypothetical protein
LFDGFAESKALGLLLSDILDGVPVGGTSLVGTRCLDRLFKKIRRLGRTFLGLREGDLVLIKSVTQQKSAGNSVVISPKRADFWIAQSSFQPGCVSYDMNSSFN